MAKRAQIEKNVSIKNRKASFEYEFLETYVAGIQLLGTEIKSIRQAKVQMQEAFCSFEQGELFVREMYIAPYNLAGFENHQGKRKRKLLLNKKELRKLEGKLDKGLTIIPTKLFITDRGFAKLSIALARGKKLFDKRESIKEKDSKRELKNLKV
jgi:SsrA-binding protein